MGLRFSKIKKPLFVYAIFGLVLFSGIYLWVDFERDKEKEIFQSLEISDNRSFAVLLEAHPSKRKFTYQVSDERGRIHEISETVDEHMAKRLRVGDTVPVFRKTNSKFGKTFVYSTLSQNQTFKKNLDAILDFCFYGIVYFSFQTLLSVVFLFVKNPQ